MCSGWIICIKLRTKGSFELTASLAQGNPDCNYVTSVMFLKDGFHKSLQLKHTEGQDKNFGMRDSGTARAFFEWEKTEITLFSECYQIHQYMYVNSGYILCVRTCSLPL